MPQIRRCAVLSILNGNDLKRSTQKFPIIPNLQCSYHYVIGVVVSSGLLCFVRDTRSLL